MNILKLVSPEKIRLDFHVAKLSFGQDRTGKLLKCSSKFALVENTETNDTMLSVLVRGYTGEFVSPTCLAMH